MKARQLTEKLTRTWKLLKLEFDLVNRRTLLPNGYLQSLSMHV